jgi:hypothetical protein
MESRLKKHSHLLIYIGALIVFMTFIVKENLHEYWKETANSIETAESTYSLHQDFTSLNKSIVELQADIKTIREHFLGPTPDKEREGLKRTKDTETMNEVRFYLKSLIVQYHDSFANLRYLTEKAPDKELYDDQIKQLDIQASHLEAQIEGVDAKNGQKFMAALDDFQNDAEALISQIKRDIESVRASNLSLSNRASWVSGLLYALGWGLGLIGKLYGVPEAAASE